MHIQNSKLSQTTTQKAETASAQQLKEQKLQAESTDTVERVDFPEFVSGLIEGVFQANVETSIQQMEEYAELVGSVSQSVDEFSEANISEDPDREYLIKKDDDD